MASVNQLDSRELLEKAYERMLPALGYLHSSVAGFAASIVVFTTWALRKTMSERNKAQIELDSDYSRLVQLRTRIRTLENRYQRLKKAVEKTSSDWEKKRLKRQLSLVEKELEDLYEEYDLLDLRINAVEKLIALKEEGALRNLGKILDQLYRGDADESLYDVLRILEDRWRKRELTKEAFQRIIESG